MKAGEINNFKAVWNEQNTHFSPINCFKIDRTNLFNNESENADVLVSELIVG